MSYSPHRKITALRFHGRKDLRLDNVAPQPCGPNDVRLKVAYCGICGSDIHEYAAGPIFAPNPGSKHPWTGVELPVTMGHEMSGVVEEVGAAVHDIHVGQHVAVNPAFDDRHHGVETCSTCLTGKVNICERFASNGFSAPGGGFADEIVVPAISCLPLPDNVSLKSGALLEPLAVAWHAIRLSGFQPGQNALVLGAGPIGLAILILLRVWGAGTVAVSEVSLQRKLRAQQFGADLVIDPTSSVHHNDKTSSNNDPVVLQVRRIAPSGVDVAFEATGIQSALNAAVASVRAGGTIFNVAIHERPVQLSFNQIFCFEKRMLGGMCYTKEDFDGVLEAIEQGKISPEDMVTSVISLDEVIGQGFHELMDNKDAHVKILVSPGKVDN
ncbi:GroES-like protein [Aspergillus heterothallicus]